MDIAYYTCLNSACVRYRGIFIEGDPEHADCDRAQLFLEPTPRSGAWPWVAAVSLAIAGLAALRVLSRRARRRDDKPPLGERQTQTWSGSEQIEDQRRGHRVPPPISQDTIS